MSVMVRAAKVKTTLVHPGHYNLRDDGSEEAMHPAVSLGDLGERLECEEGSCNSPLKLPQKRSQKG